MKVEFVEYENSALLQVYGTLFSQMLGIEAAFPDFAATEPELKLIHQLIKKNIDELKLEYLTRKGTSAVETTRIEAFVENCFDQIAIMSPEEQLTLNELDFQTELQKEVMKITQNQ